MLTNCKRNWHNKISSWHEFVSNMLNPQHAPYDERRAAYVEHGEIFVFRFLREICLLAFGGTQPTTMTLWFEGFSEDSKQKNVLNWRKQLDGNVELLRIRIMDGIIQGTDKEWERERERKMRRNCWFMQTENDIWIKDSPSSEMNSRTRIVQSSLFHLLRINEQNIEDKYAFVTKWRHKHRSWAKCIKMNPISATERTAKVGVELCAKWTHNKN